MLETMQEKNRKRSTKDFLKHSYYDPLIRLTITFTTNNTREISTKACTAIGREKYIARNASKEPIIGLIIIITC